jgi:hypothetical protein
MRRMAYYSGIAGPILFVVTVLIEGATRPGYSAWHNFASDLALGPGGGVQVANFIVSGALVAFFAYAVPNRWGAILIAVFGGALILAGLFVTDPSLGYPPGTPPGNRAQTVHGAVHGAAGATVFFSVAAAAFVLARAFPDRPWWPWYARATGLVVVAGFLASVLLAAQEGNGGATDTPVGLCQRVAIVAGWGFISVTAYRLLQRVPPDPDAATGSMASQGATP